MSHRHAARCLSVVLTLVAAQASAQSLTYYGGPVVSNPNVVTVAWGSTVDTAVTSEMSGFYSAILNSPYLDWVSEYSTVGLMGATDSLAGSNQRIGRGAFVGSYTITPSNTATTVTVAQVATEIAAQVTAGHLPAPVLDAQGLPNTVYMVNFPLGVTIDDGSGGKSCVLFCGIQGTVSTGGKSAGLGMVPDLSPSSPCNGGCGTNSSYLQNVTEVHAHILLNIVTDLEVATATATARPLAWLDSTHGNICDICNQKPATISGYTVEKGWSNREANCIASAGTALAVCDGGSAYCRQCSAADNGQATGCNGAQAVCEVDNSNTAFGECVACAKNADCSGTTPVCAKGGASNDTCAACTADTQCAGNAAGPHCLASGACGPAVTPDGGTPDGGSGGGKSGGCSSTGGFPGDAWPVLLGLGGLLGLLARRRSRTA